MEQIDLIIEKIFYRAPITGFFVAECSLASDELKSFKITGVSEFVTHGQALVTGEWQTHFQYGQSFKVSEIHYKHPQDVIKGLLGSGIVKYVKEEMAERLVDRFGEDVLDVLDGAVDSDAGKQALRSVKGVGPRNVKDIAESWAKSRKWARSCIVAMRSGLTLRQSKNAYKEFADDFEDVVVNKPYRLSMVNGITFATADRVAQAQWRGKTPIPLDSPMRYAAAVREMLRQGELEGHLCLPVDECYTGAMALIDATNPIRPIVEPIYDEEGLVEYEGWLYQAVNFHMEKLTAEHIRRLQNAPWGRFPTWEQAEPLLDEVATVPLSNDQRTAIKMVFENKVVVITGGPGTGKTTILATILELLNRFEVEPTLAAPTGKAARRMAESTGRRASTLHRLLAIQTGLLNNVATPFFAIDEMSMVYGDLAQKTLQQCGDQVHVLMVGDVDQLPPVGAGEPFYQIILSGEVTVARLTTIHRQGRDSGIIQIAHQINSGRVSVANDDFDDVAMWQSAAGQTLKDKALLAVGRLLEKGYNLEDIAVLTPVNGGDYGQEEVNRAFQAKYNPGPFVLKGCAFKVGDPAMQIRNNYQLGDEGIMNGQVGRVVWVRTTEAEKLALEQLTQDGATTFDEDYDTKMPTVVRVEYAGESKPVGYTREALSELRLAYACTIHKSQGSEYPVVVQLVPVVRESFMLRQLAYTGVTRAKKFLALIVVQDALNMCARNQNRLRRNTNLSQMLKTEDANA